MTFKSLSQYFSKLEETSSRNEMTEILSELFAKCSAKEIGLICYLLQGRVGPLFQPQEFGMGDKMVISAISKASGISDTDTVKLFKKHGDLGSAVEELKKSEVKKFVKNYSLSISQVFEKLNDIVCLQGPGSQEGKISGFKNLISKLDYLSAKYLVRIPIGKMRLGFSDMTILDALSFLLSGSKKHKKEIERAYKVRPDLGFIATKVKVEGIISLSSVRPEIGTPILMARADRLDSAEKIIKKIGKCAIEYKYDGLRLQVHYKNIKDKKANSKNKSENSQASKIKLFSRNLEDMTAMFPDICRDMTMQLKADEAILEGEVVAYNPITGISIAFQKTMQRKRKYDIEQIAQEIPVKLYIFELLYLDGVNFINKPYSERNTYLQKIVKSKGKIIAVDKVVTDKPKEIEKLFSKSIEYGYEGIIAKRLEGTYQAGIRGFNWIKFKHSMVGKLIDTFDVLVMGYTKGEGKRNKFGVGQFLTGVYDRKSKEYVSLSKIGTGLTDEQFRTLKKYTDKLKVKEKPKEYNVEKLLTADVWIAPFLVVEIAADEITRSQVHTAGRVMVPTKSGNAYEVKEAGYALRFPRLVRFREDKGINDVTTVSEVIKIYNLQRGN